MCEGDVREPELTVKCFNCGAEWNVFDSFKGMITEIVAVYCPHCGVKYSVEDTAVKGLAGMRLK